MATYTISDNLANLFATSEVSLVVYAFPKNYFGGLDPAQYTIPSAAILAQAAATATADANGNFSLTVSQREAYHLCCNSVLNTSTWYWNWDRWTDNALAPTFAAKPTIAAGAGDGTSPPAPTVVTGSNDTRGTVTFGSGSSTAAGVIGTVTFNRTWATAPYIVISSANTASGAFGVGVGTVSTTSFQIVTQSALTASQSAGTFQFNYHVLV